MNLFYQQCFFAFLLLSLSNYSLASPDAVPQSSAEQLMSEICGVNSAIQGYPEQSSPLFGLIDEICAEYSSTSSGYSCRCRKDPSKRCRSNSVKECAQNCSKNECRACCGHFTNEPNQAFIRCMDSCCGGMGRYDENFNCIETITPIEEIETR